MKVHARTSDFSNDLTQSEHNLRPRCLSCRGQVVSTDSPFAFFFWGLETILEGPRFRVLVPEGRTLLRNMSAGGNREIRGDW